MVQVQNEVVIDGPIDQVFDQVTTTASWPEWHPATIAVGGVTDRPIQLGDQIHERARIGGQEYEGDWTVVEHQRPIRLRMVVPGSGTGITYVFAVEAPSATRFTRTLEFDPTAFAGSAADPTVLERLMFTQSQEALGKLKRLVEGKVTPRQR
jgi:hypothetical protein